MIDSRVFFDLLISKLGDVEILFCWDTALARMSDFDVQKKCAAFSMQHILYIKIFSGLSAS